MAAPSTAEMPAGDSASDETPEDDGTNGLQHEEYNGEFDGEIDDEDEPEA